MVIGSQGRGYEMGYKSRHLKLYHRDTETQRKPSTSFRASTRGNPASLLIDMTKVTRFRLSSE